MLTAELIAYDKSIRDIRNGEPYKYVWVNFKLCTLYFRSHAFNATTATATAATKRITHWRVCVYGHNFSSLVDVSRALVHHIYNVIKYERPFIDLYISWIMHAIPIIYLFVVVDVAVFFHDKKNFQCYWCHSNCVHDACVRVVFRLNNIVIFQRVRIYLFILNVEEFVQAWLKCGCRIPSELSLADRK